MGGCRAKNKQKKLNFIIDNHYMSLDQTVFTTEAYLEEGSIGAFYIKFGRTLIMYM